MRGFPGTEDGSGQGGGPKEGLPSTGSWQRHTPDNEGIADNYCRIICSRESRRNLRWRNVRWLRKLGRLGVATRFPVPGGNYSDLLFSSPRSSLRRVHSLCREFTASPVETVRWIDRPGGISWKDGRLHSKILPGGIGPALTLPD